MSKAECFEALEGNEIAPSQPQVQSILDLLPESPAFQQLELILAFRKAGFSREEVEVALGKLASAEFSLFSGHLNFFISHAPKISRFPKGILGLLDFLQTVIKPLCEWGEGEYRAGNFEDLLEELLSDPPKNLYTANLEAYIGIAKSILEPGSFNKTIALWTIDMYLDQEQQYTDELSLIFQEDPEKFKDILFKSLEEIQEAVVAEGETHGFVWVIIHCLFFNGPSSPLYAEALSGYRQVLGSLTSSEHSEVVDSNQREKLEKTGGYWSMLYEMMFIREDAGRICSYTGAQLAQVYRDHILDRGADPSTLGAKLWQLWTDANLSFEQAAMVLEQTLDIDFGLHTNEIRGLRKPEDIIEALKLKQQSGNIRDGSMSVKTKLRKLYELQGHRYFDRIVQPVIEGVRYQRILDAKRAVGIIPSGNRNGTFYGSGNEITLRILSFLSALGLMPEFEVRAAIEPAKAHKALKDFKRGNFDRLAKLGENGNFRENLIETTRLLQSSLNEHILRARRERIGQMPIGGKVHLKNGFDERLIKVLQKIFGMESTPFHLIHANQSLLLPPMATGEEMSLLLFALQKLGAIDSQEPELQAAVAGRWSREIAPLVGAASLLATERGARYQEGAFSTNRDGQTGAMIMAYDDGVKIPGLPFDLAKATGRTDRLGIQAASDMEIYQTLGNLASHLEFGGIFRAEGAMFRGRMKELLARHDLLEIVYSAPWVFDHTDRLDVAREHEQMVDLVNAKWFEGREVGPERNFGAIGDTRLLIEEMRARMLKTAQRALSQGSPEVRRFLDKAS